MIYNYIENIIDNKLPLGRLDHVIQKGLGHNERSIWCERKDFEEIIETVHQIEQHKGVAKGLSIDLEDFAYVVCKKDEYKGTKCISINIICEKTLYTYKDKWCSKTGRSTKYLIYENNEVVYWNTGYTRKYTPCNFKLLVKKERKIENLLNEALLEYYSNKYQYLYKDYYNEYKQAIDKNENKRLYVNQDVMQKAKTKAEYFALTNKACHKMSGYNFNKHSFYTGYAVAKIYNNLDDNSKKWIVNQSEVYYPDAMQRNPRRTITGVCAGIIVSNLKCANKNNYYTTAYDYVEMAQKLRHKIKITPMSPTSLTELHDQVAEKISKKDSKQISDEIIIDDNSAFNGLYDKMPKQFLPLITERQLYMESQKQHNCVYSNYTQYVKRDICAIFHLSLAEKEYTIEIRKNKKRYYLKQMEAKYNSGHTEEDWKYVEEIINKINKYHFKYI